MNLSTLQRLSFLAFLLSFYILAWHMQSTVLLKGDVSWQMHMARLVLAGGDYMKDFFEINPPLSIYLYTPAVMIQKLFSLSAIISLRIYIFSLGTLTLLICYPLIKKIFNHDVGIGLIFYLSLPFVFLVMPFTEFGQRENMLVFFIIPYLLLTVNRLEGQQISPFFSAFIGFLAALGLAIKPFFLTTWIIIEGYYFFSQRNKSYKALLKPETLCIGLCMVAYVVLVYLFYKSYLFEVIPIAKRFYYTYFTSPWFDMLESPLVLFCLFGSLVFLAPFKKNRYRIVVKILSLATLGFFLAYLAQRIPWYYHLLPALSFSIVLFTLLYAIGFKQATRYSDYLFLLVSCFVLFYAPIKCLLEFHHSGVKQKTDLNSLISYLHQTELNKPVYFLSSKTAYMVSVFEHAGCQHASRLQFVAYMQHYARIHISPDHVRLNDDENFLTNMLAQDITSQKPELIFVDVKKYPDRLDRLFKVDYLPILIKNDNFAKAWASYQYMKTFSYDERYQFDVYKRL